MRILVLSFYYPPDIGPGPLRAASIVESLLSEGAPDVCLNVMTNMQNRYQSISLSAPAFEQDQALTVRRFSLPPHQSGMVDQAKAFLVYAKSVLKATKSQQWDVVFSTSGRLMTASLGAVSKRSGANYTWMFAIFLQTRWAIFYPRVLLASFCQLFEYWNVGPFDLQIV